MHDCQHADTFVKGCTAHEVGHRGPYRAGEGAHKAMRDQRVDCRGVNCKSVIDASMPAIGHPSFFFRHRGGGAYVA